MKCDGNEMINEIYFTYSVIVVGAINNRIKKSPANKQGLWDIL